MALRSLLGAGNRLLARDARLVVGAGNGFHTSGKASMGFGSHASDNDPDVLHKEKEKNLKGEALTTCERKDYWSSQEQQCMNTFIEYRILRWWYSLPGRLQER